MGKQIMATGAVVAAVAVPSLNVPVEAESLAKALSYTRLNTENKDRSVTSLVRGTIVRKRKYRDNISLAVRKLDENGLPIDENGRDDQPGKQPPVLVMIPRSDPSMPLEGCFLGTLVEIRLKPEKSKPETKPDDDDETKEPDDDDDERRTPTPTKTTITKQHTHRSVETLKIIRCSPDPNAIQDCLRLVCEGKLPLDIFSYAKPNGDGRSTALLKDVDQATKILSLGPKDALRRAFVKKISSRIKGQEPMGGAVESMEDDDTITIRPRKRQTHIKARQRKVLEKMEISQVPMEPTFIESDETSGGNVSLPHNPPASGAAASDALTYNLPDPNDATMMSGRHPKTRREYLHDKKWPQIRWLVKRLDPILQYVRTKQEEDSQQQQQKKKKYIEVLDVGGGRGDLAVAVAEAFPDVRVTVVDLNESSLEGGRAYYRSRKPSHETDDRVRFVCGDFAEYAKRGGGGEQQSTTTRFDVVTAWHACGDLSDYALEFAVKECEANANAFVICPCCYTKRYIESFEPKWIGDYYLQQQQCTPCPVQGQSNEASSSNDIRTVQRLAEINERPEITHRAMGLINTMRLRSLLTLSAQNKSNQQQDQPTFDITLEEYDLSFSSKNLVLVGVKN